MKVNWVDFECPVDFEVKWVDFECPVDFGTHGERRGGDKEVKPLAAPHSGWPTFL